MSYEGIVREFDLEGYALQLRESPYFTYLALNWQNLIFLMICGSLILFSRFAYTYKSLFLCPILYFCATFLGSMSNLSSLYWKYLFSCCVITIGLFIRSFISSRKLRNLIQTAQLFTVALFIGSLLMWFAQLEPLTYFRSTGTIPPRLCNQTQGDFTRAMEEYVQLHAEILNRPYSERKFLYFEASDDGLGNRIQGLLSALLLAMLTNRAFVIKWPVTTNCPADFASLFGPPLSNWTFSQMLPYMAENEEVVKNEAQSRWYAYCRHCSIGGGGDPPTPWSSWSYLLCDPHFGFHTSGRIIKIRSTQWFAPVIAHNQNWREKVCQLTGPDIFGSLASTLHPTDSLQQRIQEFKKNHFEGSEVVGLQMRRLEILGVKGDREEVFWRCAAMLSKDSRTKWFLATDEESTRTKLKNLIGDRLLYVNESITRRDEEGVQNALVEMWLLGEVDHIITTPYSTFGYSAHARTSKIPYTVTHDKMCYKLLSNQPCFQYWFGILRASCFEDSMLTSDMLNQENCWL